LSPGGPVAGVRLRLAVGLVGLAVVGLLEGPEAGLGVDVLVLGEALGLGDWGADADCSFVHPTVTRSARQATDACRRRSDMRLSLRRPIRHDPGHERRTRGIYSAAQEAHMFEIKKKRIALAGAVAATAITATVVPIGMAVAGHENAVLEADLNGRAEVANAATSKRIVGDPNGRGEAYVFGIDGDATTLCYVLTVDKIATATGAHIHEGVKGTNGPIVANLAAPADGNAADCLTEGEANKFPTGEKVADILANPENFYVNVHNADYPGGAIRGQLSAER